MKTHYLYLAKIVAFNEEQVPVHFHHMRKHKADCPQPCRTLILWFPALVVTYMELSMSERGS